MKHESLQSLSAASIEELSIGYETPESHPFPLQLLETADACVLAVDHDWRLIYANPSATKQISRGTPLIGVNLWEAFPEARGTHFEDAYRRAIETGQQQRFEAWFEPLDAWFEVCATPLPRNGLSVWFRNINVRKEKEQTLALAEEKFRLAASVAADLVSEWDIVSGNVTCSKGSEPRLGFDQEFVTDTQWCADRVHPQDRDRVRAICSPASKTANPSFANPAS
jgi:PAS domain-containing protein